MPASGCTYGRPGCFPGQAASSLLRTEMGSAGEGLPAGEADTHQVAQFAGPLLALTHGLWVEPTGDVRVRAAAWFESGVGR